MTDQIRWETYEHGKDTVVRGTIGNRTLQAVALAEEGPLAVESTKEFVRKAFRYIGYRV